jgi:SUKH-4 immunity protein
MEPAEFKRRFLAHVRSDPGMDEIPGLWDELSEFVSFDRSTLELYGLHKDDVDFLLKSGLPRDAAPYLNFSAYSRAELDELPDAHRLKGKLFTLGGNGCGDFVGIELASRAVVYLMHDDDLRRVFINSSISQFAEALCVCQEMGRARTLDHLLERLELFDPPAAAPGTMWYAEIKGEG